MQSIRSLVMLIASLGSAASFACGGAPDVVKAPPATKVTWGDASEEPSAEGAADAPESAQQPARPRAGRPALREEAEEEALNDPDAIDLDALPARGEARPDPPAARGESEAPPREPAPAREVTAEAEPAEEGPAANPLEAELRRRRAQKARAEAEAKKRAGGDAAEERIPAEPPKPTYTGSDPCRADTFHVERVREACEAGGRSAAKRVMKDAIGRATANGQLLKCGDCHENLRSYALKSAAVTELKRWLGG